jgi:hypothetical protein
VDEGWRIERRFSSGQLAFSYGKHTNDCTFAI